MTSQREFLAALIERLEDSGIGYMVSGSVASSFYGEPRATKDVDLVVDCKQDQLAGFLAAIHALDWYVSDEAAKDAVRTRGMFNIVDSLSGWKADLIVRKDRAFSITEFERRISAHLLGDAAPVLSVATPEDAILSRLEWHRDTRSEQQYRDALGIAMLRANDLDRDYMRRWAVTLELEEALERLLAAAC